MCFYVHIKKIEHKVLNFLLPIICYYLSWPISTQKIICLQFWTFKQKKKSRETDPNIKKCFGNSVFESPNATVAIFWSSIWEKSVASTVHNNNNNNNNQKDKKSR